MAVEFRVSVRKSTRKPHYMTTAEEAKIEFAAPNCVRNIVVIVSELGLRYKKEAKLDRHANERGIPSTHSVN